MHLSGSTGGNKMEMTIKLLMFVVGTFGICIVSAAVREDDWRPLLRRGLRYFAIAVSAISAVVITMMLVQTFLD